MRSVYIRYSSLDSAALPLTFRLSLWFSIVIRKYSLLSRRQDTTSTSGIKFLYCKSKIRFLISLCFCFQECKKKKTDDGKILPACNLPADQFSSDAFYMSKVGVDSVGGGILVKVRAFANTDM